MTELSSLSLLEPGLLLSFYNSPGTPECLHVMSPPWNFTTMPWPITRDFSDWHHSGDQPQYRSAGQLLMDFSVTHLTDIITWKPCFKGKELNCASSGKFYIWVVFTVMVINTAKYMCHTEAPLIKAVTCILMKTWAIRPHERSQVYVSQTT